MMGLTEIVLKAVACAIIRSATKLMDIVPSVVKQAIGATYVTKVLCKYDIFPFK